MSKRLWSVVALACVLGLAGACNDATAPQRTPQDDDQEPADKKPPKTGFLILPGDGGALLV